MDLPKIIDCTNGCGGQMTLEGNLYGCQGCQDIVTVSTVQRRMQETKQVVAA